MRRGRWLTTEGYVHLDAAAAERGLETARAFPFPTLPVPADLQAKGPVVITSTGGVERILRFWCRRQDNMVFCNRTPAAESSLLPQVTNQQRAIIRRGTLR